MRNPIFILALLGFSIMFSCKQAPPQEKEEAFTNPLPGVWKMTAWLPTDSSAMVSPDFVQYKFYTGQHFIFLAYDEAADTLIMAGGGTYTAVKDTLTEDLSFTTWDSTNVGVTYTFNYQVKDGKFEQRGTMASTTPGEPDFQLAEDYEYAGLSIDTAAAAGSPSGLWRSTLAAYGDAEEPTELENGDVLYKLITPTHFYVVTFQPEEGRFRGMVFGTWEIRDGKYTEKIIVGTWEPGLAGLEIPYDYTVTDSKFEQKAVVTINGETGKIEEYYTRVE
ncbi:MAG: hypothetical protein H6564_02730 [Lewinellaceae bacterium]|nr:hypothetical protein [Lewinellaceae bacterium]